MTAEIAASAVCWYGARQITFGVDHVIDAACSSQAVRSPDDETREVLLTAHAVPGIPIRITKYATYQTSRSIPVPELVDRCHRTLDRAVRDGFDVLAAAQRANLDRFWDRADVQVKARLNPVRQQQAVRWNLYQIAQASWRAGNPRGDRPAAAGPRLLRRRQQIPHPRRDRA
jgi:alpha,alpha-trehalose phosphorylase